MKNYNKNLLKSVNDIVLIYKNPKNQKFYSSKVTFILPPNLDNKENCIKLYICSLLGASDSKTFNYGLNILYNNGSSTTDGKCLINDNKNYYTYESKEFLNMLADLDAVSTSFIMIQDNFEDRELILGINSNSDSRFDIVDLKYLALETIEDIYNRKSKNRLVNNIDTSLV